MLIVGDIGGQYDAFIRLISKWDDKIVLVGDLNDRGPKSCQMIQWAIDNQDRVTTLHSNHGDMMVDFYKGIEEYDRRDFINNGGFATLVSYGVPDTFESQQLNLIAEAQRLIPKEHIEFLESRPMYYECDDLIISHAPVPWRPEQYIGCELDKYKKIDWVWNRDQVLPMDKWQVFGHNSHWGYKKDEEDKWICIDTSRSECLTGLIWPSKKIIQEPFVMNAKEDHLDL
jgi:serine/threonine protein phosphatase 1